jgi:glutathione S-transferase
MADLILHHYATSPFSEKVRLILGAKKLSWKSVFIPAIMPKPDVLALTGGYRKTPILQIGADLYCDSALIAVVLEHLQPEPTLYPVPAKGMSRILAQWADSTLFWAAMAWNFQPKGAAEVFGKAPPEAAKAFGEDRGKMSAGHMTRLRPADAASAYKSYLRRLSDMLDNKPYLLGEVPSIADFSAYHPLWYTRRIEAVKSILDLTPAVLDWMDRIAAIGHGTPEKFSAQDAIAVAHASTPTSLLTIALGSAVTIHAESFGLEETAGTLVAASRMHYTLERTDARAGTVHVHFPRIGYVLKKAQA